MSITFDFGRMPNEKDIQWFEKNVGPRTHYLASTSVGGVGWRFERQLNFTDPNKSYYKWVLIVEKEEMLTYYLLVR